METNHAIFVEGEFAQQDGSVIRREVCIQDAIKSMSYEKGVKPTLEKYGPAIKDLYLLLVYFPGWTKTQTDAYIDTYKEQIIDARETVSIDYIDQLDISIPWNNQYFTADQFKIQRDYVAQQLEKEFIQTHE